MLPAGAQHIEKPGTAGGSSSPQGGAATHSVALQGGNAGLGSASASVLPKTQKPRSAEDGSIFTRRDARAITLALPAPRGVITDRNGDVLAQNRVMYRLSLQFPQFESVDEEFIVIWARERIAVASTLTKNLLERTDEDLLAHYRHRRWLPLYLTSLIRPDEAESISKRIGTRYAKQLVLSPVYARYYPGHSLAAHIIGYTGSSAKIPTGPINYMEPLWEPSEGRAGFEKLYDPVLKGEPGVKRLIFDSDGRKLLEEQTKRPVPGGTVVSTLNLKWQRQAEKVLRENSKRGAFVVVDVVTGEVLVMASRPSFDLNMFIPRIGKKTYQALLDNPDRPLYARAFQGAYPPASSFKPVVALAALNNGTISKRTEINCPAYVEYGRHKLWNWSKSAYGPMAVVRAMKWSNNPWFAQVGNLVGSDQFLGLARRIGYGRLTGLPLIGESPGFVPTRQWVLERYHRRVTEGDAANWAIGQGALLATPLQVAQAMAGIANGAALPKLHIIKQVHDRRGRVVYDAKPERRNWLGISPEAIEIVHEGMREVVDGGTGGRASLSFAKVCGKTGTGQWGPERKKQGVAWFAGFLPYKEPRLAFVALYEGRPGEKVSGGRNAGSMVPKFFEPLKDDVKELIEPPPKALIVVEEDDAKEEGGDEEGVLRAMPVKPGEIGAGIEKRDEGLLHALPVEPDDETVPEVSPDPEEIPEPEPPHLRAVPVEPDDASETNQSPSLRALPVE